MANLEQTLAQPPVGERELELWLQHAAGLIVFQDIRDYAIEQMDDSLSGESRLAALKAIDDAVYGLMMIIDGETGTLQSETHQVRLNVSVLLTDLETEEISAEVNLLEGDGMCMGFHGWKDGDFGSDAIVEDETLPSSRS